VIDRLTCLHRVGRVRRGFVVILATLPTLPGAKVAVGRLTHSNASPCPVDEICGEDKAEGADSRLASASEIYSPIEKSVYKRPRPSLITFDVLDLPSRKGRRQCRRAVGTLSGKKIFQESLACAPQGAEKEAMIEPVQERRSRCCLDVGRPSLVNVVG